MLGFGFEAQILVLGLGFGLRFWVSVVGFVFVFWYWVLSFRCWFCFAWVLALGVEFWIMVFVSCF